MESKLVNYNMVRGSLKTGDIVLFGGAGFISTGIKIFTSSDYSHVGGVICLPEYNFVCLLESTTTSTIKDLETGKFKSGVQMVPLSKRIAEYDGDIMIRPLEGPKFAPSQVQALMAFRKEIKGKAYERDLFELIKSAYDGPFGKNKEDLSSMFCSETQAEMYQRLQVFSEHVPSNEFTPAQFAENKNLPFINGYYLRDSIKL